MFTTSMKLQGRTILITGGGSGIGLELARLLTPANKVVIAGRDQTKLALAQREMPTLITQQLDVTSEEQGRAAIERISADLGGLDLLVNNAGLVRGYAFGADEDGAKTVEDINVNVVGALRMTRLAVPLLEASDDAAVVFMSSAVALAAVPGYAVYAATKAAIHSFARSLRAELAGSQVRVVEVLPPVVDTGQVSDLAVPKLPAAAVAEATIAGLGRDRAEIRVAAVRQLAPLARLMPRLADRIVTRALTPQRRGE